MERTISDHPFDGAYVFQFMQLPKEVRLHILQYSDLVDPRFGSLFQQAVVHQAGRIQLRSKHADLSEHTSDSMCNCCPYLLSSALLCISKDFYEEAMEAMLTNNLLILHSGHEKSLSFLESLPSVTRNRISHLDIKFHRDHDFTDMDDFKCCFFSNLPVFDALIDYISKHVKLSQLHLTLDLLDAWGYFCYDYFTSVNSSLHQRAIERLAKPLVKLNGTKSLHVYLPVHTVFEKTLEQIGTGDKD